MQTLLILLASLAPSGAPPSTAPARTPAAPEQASPGTPAAVGFDHTHEALTRALRPHVRDGLVDYRGLSDDRAALDAYLAGLAEVTAREQKEWSEQQRFAFWINAYNAYTLQLVLDHYPVKSIKDIGSVFSSVWDKEFIPLGGLYPKGPKKLLSLNHIEHDILRPGFADPRVHAAINCASVSCPALAPEAYRAERLDDQLDSAVRAWIGDESKNRFDRAGGALYISKIFDWFEKDFTQDGGDVHEWIARYAPPSIAEWIRSDDKLKTRYLDYSWELNDLPRADEDR